MVRFAALLAFLLGIPSVVPADFILVEDNRSVEMNYEGAVSRKESPGAPSWDAELSNGGSIRAHQRTAIAPTEISGRGNVLVIMDGGNPQEAISTFDVRFRFDRPTFISLTGQFDG